MANQPFRIFHSPMTGAFYASRHYKVDEQGYVEVTGAKYDVTKDVQGFVNNAVQLAIDNTAAATKQSFADAIRQIAKLHPKESEVLKGILTALEAIKI